MTNYCYGFQTINSDLFMKILGTDNIDDLKFTEDNSEEQEDFYNVSNMENTDE